jgi:glucose-1-phosphate thymidylyltransferase
MKWIVLAGWTGSRLFPITMAISKQLIPIYDKPMIYYPISVLMLAWIREILIITDWNDLENFKKLLWDWSQFWVQFFYEIQEKPEWLAQAFTVWEKFIWKNDVCLILWDNIFQWQKFWKILENAKKFVKDEKKWKIFWYQVKDPRQYWVVEFDENENVLSIEEKPEKPKSKYSIPGLYFYPNDVIKIAKNLEKSDRWEYEITDVSKELLKQNRLKVDILPRWYAWLDTWTHETMMESSIYIEILEKRQWIKIACLEEIAFKKWWIDKTSIQKSIDKMGKSSYWEYLKNIL